MEFLRADTLQHSVSGAQSTLATDDDDSFVYSESWSQVRAIMSTFMAEW